VTLSHESVVQKLRSSQDGGVPARQVPAAHVSIPSQARPSEQLVPSSRGTLTHPADGLHESAVHGLPSLQLRGELVHEPPTQRSSIVQALVSVQSAFVKQHPGTAVCLHPDWLSQPSVVHGFPSSQSGAVPGTQLPAWQVS
jgi:hypothetical protein